MANENIKKNNTFKGAKEKKPILILIRDGWGYRKEEELNGPVKGNTPFTDYLMETYPNTIIDAAGESVGLPNGYQGNSEVGHMTIGSGKIFYQSLVKIDKSISTGQFFKNPALVGAIENCKKNKSTLHVCGLLQQEGIHSHMNHCFAILDLCKKMDFRNVLVHVISDGRDAPVNNTINNVRLLLAKIKSSGVGKIATISGRYYTMDRDNRWERTKAAYDCIVLGNCPEFSDPIKYFEEKYAANETDEFIKPSKMKGFNGLSDKDSFIFYNYRSDRPRQLTKAIVEEEFEGFPRKAKDVFYVSMTEYYTPMSKKIHVAFDPDFPKNSLGEVLANNKLKQLRISETEKYAHVTFFFNGQIEKPFDGEDRILIASPKVATYDLQPEMSVNEIGDKLVAELEKDKYDVIVANFVNGDMVGHTGNWDAVLKAVDAVDKNVEKVVKKVIEKHGTALIFADHGNCEDMTEEWRTSHTLNPVPLIVVSDGLKGTKLKSGKGLQDIAPTVLKLLGIKQPAEMTGESII